jgi:hypothetical protein
MNTAYGKPDAESLPFDLRHLRRPICYCLGDGSAADRKAQSEALIHDLEKALRLILLQQHSADNLPKEFTPANATKGPAIFFDSAADLVGDSNETFTVPEGAKAYLRVYPALAVPPLGSELEAKTLASVGTLQPLGMVLGCNFERNIFGAIAYERPRGGELYNFTQLFLSRELWGVDARVLNSDRINEMRGDYSWAESCKFIAFGYIERYFVRALENYLAFAKTRLHLRPPLRVEAGLVGVKGYSVTTQENQLVGNCLRDDIIWRGALDSPDSSPVVVLKAFFELVWAICGVQHNYECCKEVSA